MPKSLAKFKNPIFILVLIILLGAVLRFYRLPEMANYDFDQEYASNFAYSVLKVYPIQLIGQGLSVEGLFMGPLYFYYLVPFFALTNLHPLGGFIGSVVLGLITIAAYYFVGKNLFNIQTGLIAAFLRAILFIKIESDWTMVPAYSCELAVIITWLLLYKIWHGENKFYPFLTFFLGLFTSFHPLLFPFYLVVVFFLILKRKLPKFKLILASIFTFFTPLVPLMIFEYFHRFLEVKRLFSLSSTSSSEVHTLKDLLYFLKINADYPTQILNLSLIPKEVIYFALLGVLIYLLYKRIEFFKDNFHKLFLPITYLTFIGYYYLFPTHVPEYYFYALFTLSFLYLAAMLSLLVTSKKSLLKITFLILLINICVYNFKILSARWQSNNLITLAYKDNIVKKALSTGVSNKQFYVSYIKQPGWNFGFDYLFKQYGKVPQTDEARPPIFTIVIPRALVSEKDTDYISGNIGLILPK